MFCIAAFIVLAIISIFSATHRKLLKKSWGCVARRVTFRPCDTNFKEEIKAKMLTKVALKQPKLVRAADIGLEVGAFLLVTLTIWSLAVSVKSGLNYYVYGTCNPSNAAACSLGAEACSIESYRPSFWTSVKDFNVHGWVYEEAKQFAKTVSAVPTRMQKWDAEAYVPARASYKEAYDQSKPTALEIIDPGCQFCKELYTNMKKVDFAKRYNLAFIAYPIPSAKEESGYKFVNSKLITQYIEATRLLPLANAQPAADWQLVDRVFTWNDNENVAYQIRFNAFYNSTQAEAQLQLWLKDMGYSEETLAKLAETARSDTVAEIIETNRKTVEDKIKTVKIPTSIFDGKRHDGVLSEDTLR